MEHKNTHEEHIGVVGVDSGQLMICDPCYIDSEWVREDFVDIRRYKDTRGKVYEYQKDFPHFEHAMPSGKTPNQLIESGAWKLVPVPEQAQTRGRFSYAGVCETTLSEKQAGQLCYKIGHTGVGVAFCSGLGDGTYNVYATYADVDSCGRRIVSVRIELINESSSR